MGSSKSKPRASPDMEILTNAPTKRMSRGLLSKKSVFHSLATREITGRASGRLLYERSLTGQSKKAHFQVESELEVLRGHCNVHYEDISAVLDALNEIRSGLSNPDTLIGQHYRTQIITFRKGDSLQQILIHPRGYREGKKQEFTVFLKEEYTQIRLLALECIRELTTSSDEFLEAISRNNDDFIVSLFSLLQVQELMDLTTSLLQDILVTRVDPFDAILLCELAPFISRITDEQFMSLCRIVSLLVFEPEDNFPMDILKSTTLPSISPKKSKFSDAYRIIDRNHAYFIKRTFLVNRLLSSLEYMIGRRILKIPHSLVMVFQGQHERIAEVASEANGATIEELIQSYVDITYFVDCMFTLSTLLTGKRAADVQARCIELSIVPKLQKVLTILNWDCGHADGHDATQMHGPGCDCNPESTLCTQYLRLLHSFCDRDLSQGKNKMFLFTENELQEMNITPLPDHAVLGSEGEKGLITAIAQILIAQPKDSIFLFWLSSVIEAFLRGSRPEYQIFMIRKGLLQFTVDSVLKNGGMGGESMQTSFDLMGELVKFNIQAFIMLDNLLVSPMFEKFIDIVVGGLVDSNVFLRATILTDEMLSQQEMSETRPKQADLKVLGFYRRNRTQILYDLMNSVSLEKLSQENICCLNTALIILIFAKRRRECSSLLHSIQSIDAVNKTPGKSLANFLELLDFWSKYYSRQVRDGISLELSSRIAMKEWRETRRFVIDKIGEIIQEQE